LTGAETAYGYDATGRQVWTRSMQATDTPGQYVYTANAYDTAFGRLMRVHYGLTAPGASLQVREAVLRAETRLPHLPEDRC
jgi:hypothetical protein